MITNPTSIIVGLLSAWEHRRGDPQALWHVLNLLGEAKTLDEIRHKLSVPPCGISSHDGTYEVSISGQPLLAFRVTHDSHKNEPQPHIELHQAQYRPPPPNVHASHPSPPPTEGQAPTPPQTGLTVGDGVIAVTASAITVAAGAVTQIIRNVVGTIKDGLDIHEKLRRKDDKPPTKDQHD